MRARFVVCVVVAGLGLAASGAAGCSFGYQSVYEGDVRFEHCYRLDDEPRVSASEKQSCWADWSRRYTYGQTRDRIGYALARERALAAPGPGAAAGAPPALSQAPNNASPQPTNAFAPPPQLLTYADAGAGDAAARGLAVTAAFVQSSAPGAACAGVCARDFAACGLPCKAEGCFNGCDERYRACMRSCF